MPELPEVETVLRGLEVVMQGQVIDYVEQRRFDLRYALPDDFANRLKGRRIVAMYRRAKYMIMELDTGESLIVHLGMSGRISIHPEPVPLKKHDHVIFHLTNVHTITYNDARRFGSMDLWPTDRLNSYKPFAGLGPEPLTQDFNPTQFAAILQNKTAPIKAILLDQRVVAGLGNIYVCEALFMAKINPNKPGADLKPEQIRLLVAAVKQVLQDAIQAGGSTLKDHQQPSGEMGYFQHRFQVYGREGKPCPVCMAPIWRMTQAGRSTFYCSSCQAN